jgi:molecular chaperone IbpA
MGLKILLKGDRNMLGIIPAEFTRAMVGVDKLFTDLEKLSLNSYPPHNIVDLGNDKYQVEVAIAGFSKDEITLTVEDGKLYISGEKKKVEGEIEKKYIHRGIAARTFEKVLKLSQNVEVIGAEMKDGMLIVDLALIIPDYKKPKQVEIK